MDEPRTPEPESLRLLLVEMADLFDAIIAALEEGPAEGDAAVRRAEERLVQIRAQLDARGRGSTA